MANDEENLWQFNLGGAFVKFQELFRNPKTRPESFEFLRRFVQDAPAGVQPELLEHLINLMSSFAQKPSEQIRIETGKTIANLQKVKQKSLPLPK